MHFGTNDLTKGVNTMSRFGKIVRATQEIDSTANIQFGFYSIVQRTDKDCKKEIDSINTRLKSYCLDKGLNFTDNSNIDESCLNDSELHLNKKSMPLLTYYILRSLYSLIFLLDSGTS